MIDPIDVRELLGHPGATIVRPVSAPVDGLETEVARVRDDVPVTGDLTLDSLVEGVLVSGTLRGTFSLRCARCLTEFEQPFSVEVHEVFAFAPQDDDEYRIDPDGLLEPDQMVRDAIGVELPFSPLCRSDCEGLCPVCGGDRNRGECPGHREVDPRWAILDELAPLLDDHPTMTNPRTSALTDDTTPAARHTTSEE